MASKVEEVLGIVEDMSVMELAELVEAFEERFGVSATAVAAAPAAAPVAPEQAQEEQTEFKVVLTEVGEKKIQVIKAVREVTDLGLKEAKELVDGAPSTVREGLERDEAEAVAKKLEEVGATAEVQ